MGSEMCIRDSFNSITFSLVFNSCVPCGSTCKTCFGHQSNQCLSCSIPKLLLGSSCVAECPRGMFHNQMTHTCDACHTACESCTGPTNSDCNSCRGMFYQRNAKTPIHITCIDSLLSSNTTCCPLIFVCTKSYLFIML